MAHFGPVETEPLDVTRLFLDLSTLLAASNVTSIVACRTRRVNRFFGLFSGNYPDGSSLAAGILFDRRAGATV